MEGVLLGAREADVPHGNGKFAAKKIHELSIAQASRHGVSFYPIDDGQLVRPQTAQPHNVPFARLFRTVSQVKVWNGAELLSAWLWRKININR